MLFFRFPFKFVIQLLLNYYNFIRLDFFFVFAKRISFRDSFTKGIKFQSKVFFFFFTDFDGCSIKIQQHTLAHLEL
jgi:hypothetical protein